MCVLHQRYLYVFSLSSQAGLLTQWSSPLVGVSGLFWAHSSTLCWLYGDSSAPSCLQPHPLLEQHPEALPSSPALIATHHPPRTRQRGEGQPLLHLSNMYTLLQPEHHSTQGEKPHMSPFKTQHKHKQLQA